MRIKENPHNGYELYSCVLRERVEEVFQYTSQITEMKRLLAEIKKESVRLRELFLTEEELNERKKALDLFDAKMRSTVYCTLKNLEGYQQFGWKELLNEGDNSDDRVD